MENQTPENNGRRRALQRLTQIVIVLALLGTAYWWLALRNHQSTDDAYVAGNVIPVSSQIAGNVRTVLVDEHQMVKAGDLLLSLDDNDARLALARAEADLAQAVRQTRQLISVSGKSDAQVVVREAEVSRARAELERVEGDLKRREAALKEQAVSLEEVQHARDAANSARAALAAAESALTAAREEQKASRALVLSDSAEKQPAVARAAAAVREAMLAVARTEVRAPVAGQIAKRSAQPGARVQAGTPLLAVVPLDKLWVDANFKEVQLHELRIGQPVVLEADLYGSDVEYHGTVAGFAAGTGSAFSLLPPQNATGNWIKVVQRVPVRINLDSAELAKHPLRVGLSMTAKVDTSKQEGALLANAKADPALATKVFDAQLARADARVAEIVAANLGK